MDIVARVEAATEAARREEIERQNRWREEDLARADQLERDNLTWRKQVSRDTWILCIVSGFVTIVAGAISGPLVMWLLQGNGP
jgi:hypothetical protein